ncbi:MAG: tyrosine-type recombinase/integrase [Acidimicrobiales bacterium]
MAAKRRRWGRVRRLPSGRYQARYPGPDAQTYTAPHTFPTKTDAELWLVDKEAELRREGWQDPNAGRVALGAYAERWIAERDLAPATRQRYRILLRLHVRPFIGDVDLVDLTPSRVRGWRKELRDKGRSEDTLAKAYRFLKAVLNTATLEDDPPLIRRNPCRIKGAGTEPAAEREPPTMVDVFALADAIGGRWKSLVLVAAFCALRWGELVALRRRHLDTRTMTLRVELSTSELAGHLVDGPPKSKAGRRTVRLPEPLALDLRRHLREWSQPGRDGRVFTSPKGGTLRRSNFNRQWKEATAAIGRPDLRVHDLRHAGATWAAEEGATIRELMEHLGHSSSRAALIYQHAVSERHEKIAVALAARLQAEQLKRARGGHDGQSETEAS